MGEVELDNDKRIAWIRARIVLYGDAASDSLAHIVASDIAAAWNNPRGTVEIKGGRYLVLFDITGRYEPGLTDMDVITSTDRRNNYFRVEEYAHGNISFVDGLNSNTGYFKLDNLLNRSSTAAHEFGHTLGLDHPHDLDIRGHGIPGIMYPRGTIVDPPYQYDPNALPLKPGGTMDPAKRVVLDTDIGDLRLNNLEYDETGVALLGAFTNVWHDAQHPDHLP